MTIKNDQDIENKYFPFFHNKLVKIKQEDILITPVVKCKYHRTSKYPCVNYYKPISKTL